MRVEDYYYWLITSMEEYLLTYIFYMIIYQYVVYKFYKIQYVELEEYQRKRKKKLSPPIFAHFLKGGT